MHNMAHGHTREKDEKIAENLHRKVTEYREYLFLGGDFFCFVYINLFLGWEVVV